MCSHYNDEVTWTTNYPGPDVPPIPNSEYEEYAMEYANGAKDHQIGGSHYKDFAIQPIDFIMQNSLSYLQGNVIKYITRYKAKNGVEDLRKAQHYIDMMIEEMQ